MNQIANRSGLSVRTRNVIGYAIEKYKEGSASLAWRILLEEQERQVVYYGAYANASRLRRSHRQSAEDSGDSVRIPFPEEPTPFEQQCRLLWAQLIKQVWLEDPLLCPECGSDMRIISFITDPPEMDRILRHIKWQPGELLVPYIRPPPEILKVAESPS